MSRTNFRLSFDESPERAVLHGRKRIVSRPRFGAWTIVALGQPAWNRGLRSLRYSEATSSAWMDTTAVVQEAYLLELGIGKSDTGTAACSTLPATRAGHRGSERGLERALARFIVPEPGAPRSIGAVVVEGDSGGNGRPASTRGTGHESI